MSYDAIGRRYARALFELGKEEGNLPALQQNFADFAAAYAASAELREVLDNPLVPEKPREAILVEIAQKVGAGETAQRGLRLIAQHRRLRALPDIARHLSRLVDDDAKVVRAEVISAAPLSEAYVQKLKAEIEKVTGNKVTIERTVDPSLIAGVVTKIGDRVVDGSALSRLRSLRSAPTDLS
jgi:F-type H+-transporting ATPase subunit delta